MAGEIIFSLLIEPDVDKAPTMKTEDDGENNHALHICCLHDESEYFRVYSRVIYTILIHSLIFPFYDSTYHFKRL